MAVRTASKRGRKRGPKPRYMDSKQCKAVAKQAERLVETRNELEELEAAQERLNERMRHEAEKLVAMTRR